MWWCSSAGRSDKTKNVGSEKRKKGMYTVINVKLYLPLNWQT